MFAYARPQDYVKWLESKYRAIAGREEDDDATIEAEVREAHADWDDDQVAAEVEKIKTERAAAADDDDDDDDDKDGSKALTKELEKSRTELKAAQQTIANLKKEVRASKQKQAKDSGNWEVLAKERETEVNDLKEQLQASEERATTSEGNLDNFQREVRVTRLASKLGYRDPGDAIALLGKDDTVDDKTAERALRKLAEGKKYLVDERRATGRSMNGGTGDSDLFTKEQMEKMTTAEVETNWDKVQKSMAALPRSAG